MGTSRGHVWALFGAFGGTCLSMGLSGNRGLICSHFSRYIWDAFPRRNQTPFQEHRGASAFGASRRHFWGLLGTFGDACRRMSFYELLSLLDIFWTFLKENRGVAGVGHFSLIYTCACEGDWTRLSLSVVVTESQHNV